MKLLQLTTKFGSCHSFITSITVKKTILQNFLKILNFLKNSSPNTNDLYIHCMVKSTGTPPSLEEKKTLPNCGNKDGSIIYVLKNFISSSVATVLKCMKWLYPYVPICHWYLVMFGEFFMEIAKVVTFH